MEALGVNLGFLIVQVLNFVILALVLYAWAYKPILGMLDERKAKIAQGLEDARVAAEARANAEKEAAKILADAQADAAKRVAEATQRADQAARDVLSSAETEKAQKLKAATAEAEEIRLQALSELRPQVISLALAAAQQVVGEVLKKHENPKALVEDFFSGIKGGKVTVLEGVKASGVAVEVTSALELDAAAKATVQKDLAGASDVKFRVDPNILGGLVVRMGDRVIDGSARSKFEGLKQNVK